LLFSQPHSALSSASVRSSVRLPAPPPELAALSAQLCTTLVKAIERDGPMPFSSFMRSALYEPGLGYYVNGLHKFGEAGDFITAPEIGTLFAKALAGSLTPLANELGPDWTLLELGPGDLVLQSARIIPGNEGDVHEMWNRLAARGVELCAERAIHASGHAQQDELEELIRLVQPKAFVPVHGETRFLSAHAALARRLGVESQAIGNGDRLDLPARGSGSPLQAARSAKVHLETRWNDGPSTGDEEAMRLKERKRIAWNGLVVVDAQLVRDPDGTAHANDLRLETRALFLGPDDAYLKDLHDVAVRTVAACPAQTPWSEIGEAVKASVRAAARRATEKRPEVIVVFHDGRLA